MIPQPPADGHPLRVRPALAVRIRLALSDLTRDWPALTAASAAGAAGASKPGSRVPLLTEALHLREHAPRVLVSWCRVIFDELQVCPAVALDGGDAPKLARWLATHADWIADQDLVGDEAATELEDLAAAAERLVAPTTTTRVPVGDCPYDHCTGQLCVVLHEDGTREPAATCDMDAAHTWEQEQWRGLARLLGDHAPSLMTDEALADWMRTHLRARVQPGTIRSWAARYPVGVRRDERGLYDRVEVARWYVAWREQGSRAV